MDYYLVGGAVGIAVISYLVGRAEAIKEITDQKNKEATAQAMAQYLNQLAKGDK